MALALLAAACGDSDDGSGDGGSTFTDVSPGASDDDGSGDSGSSSGSDGSGDSGDGGDASDPGDAGPDNDDAAEILGQDSIPDEVEEMMDDIDDVVSIGECRSDLVGLAMPSPDGWRCRVLDQAAGGLDGFTLFTDGNELNITIGTPSGLPSPCEMLQACDDAVPIQLSDNFPDTMSFELVGTITIWGTHKNSDAELVITTFSALTDEELDFITMVLDSVVEIG